METKREVGGRGGRQREREGARHLQRLEKERERRGETPRESGEGERERLEKERERAVSYTHLTLPTRLIV